MCLHDAPHSIPINLIIDMQHDYFQKKNLTFDPSPEADGAFKERVCAFMLLHLSFPLI